METVRQFATWANRDTANGKLEFSRFIDPLNEFSFATYMQSKQIIWWNYRRWDNWKKWIPEESLFDSLIRHVKCLELLRDWYVVDEINHEWWIIRRLFKDGKFYWTTLEEWKEDFLLNKEDLHPKDIVWELNAIRFNAEAMKKQHLTGEIVKE